MKTYKKLGIGLCLLMVVLAGILHFRPALAAAPTITLGNDFKFVDAAHITGTVNNQLETFIDSDASGTNSIRNWQPQGDLATGTWCNYKTSGTQRWGIEVAASNYMTQPSVSATLELGYLNGNKCTPTNKIPLTISNSDKAATAQYAYDGSGNIVSVDGSQTFKPAANNPGTYIFPSKLSNCEAFGVIITSSQNAGTLYLLSTVGSSLPSKVSALLKNPGNCKLVQQLPIQIAGSPTSGTGGGTNCTPGDANCASASDTSSSCIDDRSLSWMICPVLNGLSRSADGIESYVASQLNFSVSENLGPSVEKAWTVFRTLTSVIIVIILLIMVFSQAFGGGPFDAYTIRKMLPKLVAAIILMQISWVLCEYLIRLSNDAGQAVGQLMAAPFGGPNQLELGALIQRLQTVGAVILGVATTGALITSIVASGAIILYGWPVLVMAIILVLLALIVALATLLFRNALIILLVIFSPLAFLAYVLPGTDRYWKIWKDNFVKLLVFFPLVIAIIYGGRIFAWIVAGLGTAGPLDLVFLLIGFFGPYFFLPKTFKWGGSFLAMASKSIGEAAPFKKGAEVARRELVSGEDSAMRRKMGHFAAEYVDRDENGKQSWWKRTSGSMLAGRFIPTQRAKASMIARGNAHKGRENELEKAVQERRREKAASRTGNVMAGKQMDLDTISESAKKAADAARKGNTYAQKGYERQAKEAMRDLIATGSTLELNNEKIIDVDGKEKFVWQTGMWRDLLNGSPDLYRQVKGDAPDWVPHRNPSGLPKYRGDDFTEEKAAERRAKLISEGSSPAQADAVISEWRTRAENLKTAYGTAGRGYDGHDAAHPDYRDVVQQASSLHETVTEMDAGSLARVHPTYFERIGGLAERGQQIYDEGVAKNDEGLKQVGRALKAPAIEFGQTVERLAKTRGGREALEHMMGGADTMEHLDYGLQFSELPHVVEVKPDNWDEATQGPWKKGKGSLLAVLEHGERDEIERSQAMAAGTAAGAASNSQGLSGQSGTTQQAGQTQTTQTQAPASAWTRGPGGAMVLGQPQVVQPAPGGQFEVRIDHGQLATAIGEQVGAQFRQALKEAGLHQQPNISPPVETPPSPAPPAPEPRDEDDRTGGDEGA